MTSSAKIFVALIALASVGAAAYFLTNDDSPRELSDLATSGDVVENSTASGADMATPAAETEGTKRVEPRAALPKPVEETREEKLARKRAKGPFLKGRIVDAYGNPIEGAYVQVASWQAAAQGMMLAGMTGSSGAPSERSRDAVKTDADGRFSAFRKDKLGLDVSISIGARGFLPSKERELLGDEGTIELGDYSLEPGVVIRGTVINEVGQPVEGARVKRTDGEGGGMFEFAGAMLDEFGMGAFAGGIATDESGVFELPYEEPGSFELTVVHEEYPNTIFEGETPPAGGVTNGLVVRMNPGASIAGRLKGMPPEREKVHIYARKLDGESEGGAFLEMMGDSGMMTGSHNALVATTGEFEVKGLEPGAKYELRAIEKGGMFDRRPCSEKSQATAGARDIELEFDSGASLTFQVVDSVSGDPLTTLDVNHSWADGTDVFAAMASAFGNKKDETYPEGRVVIHELRPKEDPSLLRIRVKSPGYLEFSREDISIPKEGQVDIGTIRLRVAPRVRVHVTEAKTGKPVARARVRLRKGAGGILEAASAARSGAEIEIEIGDDPDIDDIFDSKTVSGKTDSKGWVELPAFEMDDGVLIVKSPKYSEFKKENIRVNATGTKVLEASLVRGGEVEVSVRDGANRPVPGAMVRHKNSDGRIVESKATNKKGIAKFRRIKPGPHSFIAVHETGSLRGMFGSVNFSANGGDDEEQEEEWMTVAVVDGEVSRLTLTAPGFGILDGTVTANGVPLVGATVSLSESGGEEDELSRFGGAFGRMLSNGGLSDVSDDKGMYKISSIPAGEYSFVVRHPDLAMSSILDVEVQEGDNRFDASLSLAILEGIVLDSNGDPVAGAKIDVLEGESNVDMMNAQAVLDGPMADFLGTPEDNSVRTGVDGSFTVRGVREDVPIFVTVRHDGYASARSESVTVKKGETRSGLDVELVPAGSVVALVSGTDPFEMVEGYFLGEADDETPEPAKFAFARNGKAVLKDLREGPWRIRINGEENEANHRVVEVTAGQRSEVTLPPPSE